MARRSKRKAKKADTSRHFSFSFLIAIPAQFILGSICLFSFLGLLENYFFEREVWATFAMGIIGAITLIGSSKIPRFRTFIHELKHAIVVVFTGNRVKDFHVDVHTGHVEYQMYSDKVHFAPIIALAPYFLPIFSFPMLILCICLDPINKPLFCIALGLSLGADIAFGIGEIHPHQSDLKRVVGGFLTAGAYISGALFSWTNICLLWVLGGRNAFVYTGYVIAELTEILAGKIYS